MTDNPSPYYKTEQDHANTFECYWKDRGVQVKTKIDGDFRTINLRSDLVLRVPIETHGLVFGRNANEIKEKKKRKWQ